MVLAIFGIWDHNTLVVMVEAPTALWEAVKPGRQAKASGLRGGHDLIMLGSSCPGEGMGLGAPWKEVGKWLMPSIRVDGCLAPACLKV